MSKSILCYGDSNTHGYVPETGRRHPFNSRWTGVLQKELGGLARVIEEGLNGRTTVHDLALRVGRNGSTYLPILVESHAPIDILVLMLGTNDILHFSDVTANDAANGVSRLIDITRLTCARLDYPWPTILIIAPPIALPLPFEERDVCLGNPSKSHEFALHYKRMAKVQNCLYLDASKIVSTSEVDGVHLDAENHQKLGLAIAKCLSDSL